MKSQVQKVIRRIQVSVPFDPALLFAIGYFFVLLPSLGKNRLLGLDESMYANVALAAARDHHWMPMFFEGRFFWEKPPLALWLQSLSVWLFGPNETALRLCSAMAGAFCVYFTWRLGAYLGKSPWAGLVCAVLLGLQEHFILYCRIATTDMLLACCLLGLWWKLTKAFELSKEEDSPKELLTAGLWLAAAIWTKSWFGLILLPGIGIALWFCRPWPFFRSQFYTRFLLPGFLSLFSWIFLYLLVYGNSFWEWELHRNVMGRLYSGEFQHISHLGGNGYNFQFYADLVQKGLKFLWPLLPLGFFLWYREISLESREKKVSFGSITGCLFFFYYSFFILCFLATLINYLLPLAPLAALSVAFILRARDDFRVVAAGSLAFLLSILNGFTPDHFMTAKVMMAFGLCGLLALPAKWVFFKKIASLFCLPIIFLILAAGFTAQNYLRHPPDPNHAWVAAVLKYPARYRGEPLFFLGEHTDGRALEFYSDYNVKAISQMPPKRPKDALLFGNGNEAVFLPAQE
jgi:4-amino-4-deoxy-L-arabinose transferase-like glycosyltransferase